METQTLAGTARALYALAPQDFTAARNEQAAAARAGGDPALAAQIRQLRRPAAAAWLVNLLQRRHRGEIDELLALGLRLRQAQTDLDPLALRQLGTERRRLLNRLAGRSHELAAAQGQAVGGSVDAEVEETLRSATTDDWAAAAVASGLLIRPLSADGLGTEDLARTVALPELVRAALPAASAAGASAGTPVGAAPGRSPDPEAADRARAAAAGRFREAERRATLARETRRLAEARLGEVTAHRDELAAELRDLAARTADLERRLAEAGRDAAALAQERAAAQRASADAEGELELARTTVEEDGR